MKNKKGLSEIRTSIELMLLVVGLIAGVLLIYLFFINLAEYHPGKNVFSLIKAGEVIASLSTFNAQAILVYVLAIVFLVFTIRFYIVFRKVKKENVSFQL